MRGTKQRGNQNAKGKSWKLYDYLAATAQVQALPSALSHLELDLRENMPCNNRAGLSGKTEIGGPFAVVSDYRALLALQYHSRMVIFYCEQIYEVSKRVRSSFIDSC